MMRRRRVIEMSAERATSAKTARTTSSSTVATTLLIGLTLAINGCVAVKPWERDLLARPDMAWEEDPRLATLKGHIGFSKEAALPAGGGASGGCGCN